MAAQAAARVAGFEGLTDADFETPASSQVGHDPPDDN